MPKPKTVTVKVTGTPEHLDEYKRLMNGELRAKVAGYTVTLVED